MAGVNKLYADRFCDVFKGAVAIKRYYFPWGGVRQVPVGSIKAIYYEPHHFDWLTTKTWGMSLTPAWWALDPCRYLTSSEASANVAIDCGEKIYKGFSVENVQQFVDAISPMLPEGARVHDRFPFWRDSSTTD